MKLQELAIASPTKQAAKVFESYFGNRVSFDSISHNQACNMLKRVRTLVAEHRRTPEFHRSEKNPSYLKLVMLEQALSARVAEQAPVAPVPGTQVATSMPADPAKQAALQSAQAAQQKRQAQDQSKQLDQQIAALQKQKADLQKQMNMPTMETRLSRRLREASEVQQAQVVLASQDMVDQVQKMSEQISAMQFKDLPALVDQIKNEVGVDQATQFNGDASAALSGLLQNLQGAKQQLEAALGVVTGQAPQVPGEDMSAPMPGEEEIAVDAEVPVPGGEEDIDAEMDANMEPAAASLGRGRR
jgi:DNA anti-recombination protein RmuC